MSREPTRLCVVLSVHWAARMGGAQYQAKCLLELITEQDEFQTYYLARAVPPRRELDGYRIVPFGRPKPGRLRMLLDLPALYRALKSLRPDVVYQRSLLPFTGVCAWYCARHGARFVFHIASARDVERPAKPSPSLQGLLHWAARRIAEYGMRRADAIVAQTEQQARTLRAEYGLEATLVVPNVHPVPVGLAPGRAAELGRASAPGRPSPPAAADRPARVIWVANFKAVKNPELFVDLAQALAHRDDAEFVMIGRPGRPERYTALHERITRLQNLRYLGELPLERANDEIAASDLLVNTSTAEGFPNTFIQAWLRGVPVVSSQVDPDGCLSNGGAGIVVGDGAQLARVVAGLLDDRARLERLGRAARAYAIARHSPEGAAPLVELLAALGRRPGGGVIAGAPRAIV